MVSYAIPGASKQDIADQASKHDSVNFFCLGHTKLALSSECVPAYSSLCYAGITCFLFLLKTYIVLFIESLHSLKVSLKSAISVRSHKTDTIVTLIYYNDSTT